MPLLFTVRWPVFARLEAVALFPVAVTLAGERDEVRGLVNRALVPALMPLHDQWGLPDQVIVKTAVALVIFLPFLALLLLTDRFLTIRKGFALLSFIAIGIWAWAALELAGLLSDFVPENVLAGIFYLGFDQEVALAAGSLALLLHLRPVWTGLRDQGEVADRLVNYHGLTLANAQKARDVYYRQTAAFREWRPEQQFEGHAGGPRESSAVNFLWVLTWLVVIVGLGTAYLNWTGHAGFGHPTKKAEAAPAMPTPTVVAAGVKGGDVVATQVVQIAPVTPPLNPHAPANSPLPAVASPSLPAVAIPPLPAVNRPSELSSSVQTAGIVSGPNEAVAERGGDGSFAFDAVVNGGTHVRMLFDTGASVVGLRAEDATRLGIPVDRLNYSAKIKTANGTAEVAPVMIDTMMVGNITLRNVPGFVAKEGMLQENLLGQTFLARLSGFNVERNLLVLKGR